MSDYFFDRPILNSPYEYPSRHWELDESGQPTSHILDRRRRVSFITPIPRPKKRGQHEMVFDAAAQALEKEGQQYELMEVINELRRRVDAWRSIPDSGRWRVTPETARLLKHWRRHRFADIRPFFCQVEAAETAIWLTEVAPGLGNEGRRFLDHLAAANEQANPGLARLALKLATGAGKTTVMAMLIAWQTVNAVRRPGSRRFTRGFLMVTPGITIRDRLRVLQPNDPDSYYRSRELVPADMLGDLDRAKIVITNYHASTSKLVHDYVSGFQRENEDGSTTLVDGRLELFRNFDGYGNPLARPRTLLIDSEQLESGQALDKNFRAAASDEIERFRSEIIKRTGDRRQAENLSDQDLLREVMNTVGKAGRLGGDTRCVVSVSMLTEGWDASTVTHVLGVRAFGTQLLCEQVIGRALRRQSYDLNEEDLFDVEYADVLGIPFDFTARPVIAPPQPPRETVQVRAVSPERDACEIRFPRVQGYRVELPEERLSATFDDNSTLVLTPDLVGPSKTRNEGIVGEGVELSLEHLEEMRPSTVVFHLTRRLLETRWRDPGEEPKLHLFGQLKRITRQWLKDHLVCKGGTYPAQLLYQSLADTACERITRGIVARHLEERPVQAVLDAYNPVGSTMHVRFTTSKKTRWETDAGRCHVNWAIYDSEWEAEFCRVAEAHPRVRAYVKNHGLGLEVPYRFQAESRTYVPDFIVLIDDGHGAEDLLHLVVEIKGFRREDAKEKADTMRAHWVPGVNGLRTYGRWDFAEFGDVYTMQADFGRLVEGVVVAHGAAA